MKLILQFLKRKILFLKNKPNALEDNNTSLPESKKNNLLQKKKEEIMRLLSFDKRDSGVRNDLFRFIKHGYPPRNNRPTASLCNKSSPFPANTTLPDVKTYPTSANSNPFLAFCSTRIIVLFSFF